MTIAPIPAGMHHSPIDRANIHERAAQRFEAADTDGSGGLSLEELEQAIDSRPGRSARIADNSALEAFFSGADVDGDGEVTISELASARSERSERSPDRFSIETLTTLLQLQEDSGS